MTEFVPRRTHLRGKFPANREIYREFYENRAVWQKLARKNAAKSVSCRTIPYKMKQGINSRRTGNLLSRAGNLQRLAGNCPPCAGISPELSRFPHSVVETLTLVISRRHTSSSRMIDNSFQCSFPTCSRSLCRASCGRQLVLRGNPRTNARPCRRPVCPGSPESPRRPAPCPTSAGGPARRTQARLEAAAAQEKRRLRREVGSRVSAHHGPGEATLTPLILVRIQVPQPRN